MAQLLLTFEEVSDMLRIPVPTLRDWRQAGKGPKGFRLGNQVRFKAADVEAWLEEQYAAADSRPGAA